MCYYRDETDRSHEVQGLCQIRLLCAQTEFPLFGHKMKTIRNKQEAVFYSLCRTCTYLESKTECTHDEREREFFVTCTLHEAAVAVMYGDTIDFLEAWVYTELKHIFAPFTRLLISHKVNNLTKA